jgi:hypothetical protein
MTTMTLAACTRNSPTVSSIGTMVPEQHPRMSTMLKHLKSHQTPTSANLPSGHSTSPAMEAVVVDCVSVVYPQLAPIIGDKLEVIAAAFEDSHAPCPAHSEMITSPEARPSATCVAIIHHTAPASHVRSAAIQVLTPTPLTKVENILAEETSAISGAMECLSLATRAYNSPSVSSIWTMVPEEHPSMTSTFEHL